ncbi:MmcQ/YjbR family DNA-binding protein [Lacicoccus qingdaonensis]|uniref:Predicted DNA-binding protein, MmcQ/YjbR family n=1 Tax=Lacicoccus qingdaonensis TaxID=576118 RepID=A0A1G9FS40_9BACL|nr:MmcQ/YjbR family DNA-binding protein [Salinicoccus qingdaonensis]SDK90933.1 Predicted DNA-binding protein, MmcQ/YjbR family [Salinicoccus qingdaonensis]
MIQREDIFDFVSERYGVRPDYPWKGNTTYAVLRHKDNEKWFGLVMDITAGKLGLDSDEKIDVLNVKVRKEFVGPLREKAGIYKAYHMDKNNWVTINLDEVGKPGEIQDLIAESYELTE